MLKVTHQTLILISGLIWLGVGCILLPVGLNILVESLLDENALQPHPLLSLISSLAGGIEQAALISIAFSLSVGFIKGRYLFAKTVARSVKRFLNMPTPISIAQIYPWQYYLLLGSMGFLGWIVRLFPSDIRGCIDIAVGAALINGAIHYFRAYFQSKSVTCGNSNL